ncbi:uncharacterized protein CTHT_0021100 [Thermochaetoides thermophila DSM 1495]|uniref:Cyanovirin-N domain-containing protein n=1 Tax=Chaetomium thermophilum (strain DSM 1495 / CBS 144.50 / IMI 039719) TaxID=759272 RepID=G0S3H9_CHATD|nr:hypothetical protein CTHT_0021100 [Thermochaetoides thermophila DSM 1495]EGS22562.1 hypothetical protein CTHT_0021100 [Thermochaetoides thermophila DSM 1495]
MSFHISASNIRVEDGHILKATLFDADGNPVEAEFDLDNVIGNNDGKSSLLPLRENETTCTNYQLGNFEWGGVNFSQSAENISFAIEGGDSVPVLRASLKTIDGELVDRDINLAERIGNNNGSFVFE